MTQITQRAGSKGDLREKTSCGLRAGCQRSQNRPVAWFCAGHGPRAIATALAVKTHHPRDETSLAKVEPAVRELPAADRERLAHPG
ncbi:hypothetical protein AMR42_11195 [Limnothrix sp. PR1529]|nr:hypothetical protein BCR12_17640 [Limnothrix sp. P13C2]PIB09977.1 hypothetical protein AMR42_11195 [Limnothrix sp. PR1529]